MGKEVFTADFDVDGSFTFDKADLNPSDDETIRDAAYQEAVEKMADAMEQSPEEFIGLREWEAKESEQ